uniref:Peptidase C14 caspase domain-containing protein n=1 Tax=Populus davidiana TaxID=266767 RepID=A0A6M2FDM9_9ROSI
MMDTRSQCYRCRQWFSVPPNTATIKCPSCKFETKTHSFERSKSLDGGRISFRSFIETARTRLSRSGTGSSKSYKSLNCKPSTLLFSESLSGLRPCRKRALLIGVTYKNSKHKLKGTIIDVKGFRGLLMDTFTFPKEDIRVLTEEEPEPDFFPTKKNIQNSFKWLVEDCMAGDSLVFYFSGHGIKQFDLDGDESDGFDETICPVDFMEAGTITDDEIKSAIVRPLKKGVTLNAIVDACHSGTVLDLPYVYNRKEKKWKNSTRLSEDEKRTDRGLAISIAACEDIQVAADTSSCIGKSSINGGAMTSVLIQIVEKNPTITYGKLLDSIHEEIEKANKEGCLPRIIKGMLNNILSQRPQLSASKEFNVNSRFFILQ